ncbi:hypothetical protein [Streptomyces formicae]|uniref:Uncharacterized protein n=1 Tax=Streptomyces formicae TaxID=1616117 RepID=A0A291QK00_9ACTN|nr:hypothetical protein [Streptomyces formicae]ATL31765.1 hypothetical protein KY5_6747c [Streptomyces formicae]
MTHPHFATQHSATQRSADADPGATADRPPGPNQSFKDDLDGLIDATLLSGRTEQFADTTDQPGKGRND